MALTLKQMLSVGFKPTKKKSPFAKSYDTLVLAINKTDYLYLGYNPVLKEMNFKKIWKSFIDTDGNRMTYQVTSIGDTGFKELKNYVTAELKRANDRENNQELSIAV